MVADDSSTVRKFVSFSLALENFQIITAVDGMDALEKISRNTVDLAIVDLNMPNMDGFELIRAIRNSPDLKTLPVIILSSETSEKSKQLGRDAGADAYLEKPFNANRIKYQVSKFLSLP
ncbi:MAG TPA: response regulator [Candidatus Marinimicrobia bacterium]|nr:MAG: response regulator [Candidatus Marinimicrobia bacterium CG_4_10_14_0_2_um_filter_48_9]PJA54405.1 MAG: response regulator [Candidatus Marinimicrobia bacterium CG_4_9_14_3_um_filter_48_9]HCW76182.1 response regulator [Candidatus Neomarinimicrobiota bacterium]